jgi:hypothetical protein
MIITEPHENSIILQELYENHPRWVVILNNGKMVRSNEFPSESWKELGLYVKENSLKIESFCIAFRDNYIGFPVGADGYFFRCSILATHGWEKHSFIAGYLKDGILSVEKYELPELSYLGRETRDISSAGQSLILC